MTDQLQPKAQNKPTAFCLMRFSLVQALGQQDLFTQLPPEKGLALVPLFQENLLQLRFVYHGTDFALLGIKESRIGDDIFYSAKFAKKSTTSIGELTERNEIERQKVDDWIAIWITVEIKHQYIAVEYSREFGDIRHAAKAIEHLFSEYCLKTYGYMVLVEPVLQENAFWKIVQEAERIYSIKLRLISPNIFGANAETKKSLDELRMVFNQQEVSVSLVNKNGELKVDSGKLAGALEYIENGEGTWAIRARGPGERRSKQHKSESHPIKIHAVVPSATDREDGESSDASAKTTAYAEAMLYGSLVPLISKRHG